MEEKNVLINLVDDKCLVIFCATLLGMTSVVLLGVEGIPIVREVIVGMFGVAIGRALK